MWLSFQLSNGKPSNSTPNKVYLYPIFLSSLIFQCFGVGAAVDIARGIASESICIFNSGPVIFGSNLWGHLLNTDEKFLFKSHLVSSSNCLQECK